MPPEAKPANDNQSFVLRPSNVTSAPAPGPSNVTSAPNRGPSEVTSAPAPGPSKVTCVPAPRQAKFTAVHVPGPTIQTMIWADRKETNQLLNGIEEICEKFECDTDLVNSLWEKDIFIIQDLSQCPGCVVLLTNRPKQTAIQLTQLFMELDDKTTSSE